MPKQRDPGRTRTCNLKIRSLTRYPLRHRAARISKNLNGSGGIRTHAFKWRLELESSALDHSAKKPFTGFSAGSFNPNHFRELHQNPKRLDTRISRFKQRGIRLYKTLKTYITKGDFLYFLLLRKEPMEMATKVNQEPLEPWTRESNQVAIAHLHTTLNKSRDEKLEVFRMNFTYYPGSVITWFRTRV